MPAVLVRIFLVASLLWNVTCERKHLYCISCTATCNPLFTAMVLATEMYSEVADGTFTDIWTALYIPLSPTVQRQLVVSGVRMPRLIMAVREGL